MDELREAGKDWHYVKEVDERILNAVTYLETVSFEKPVNVVEMANSQGIHVRHLSRLFHREYGQGPKAYQTQHKLKKAIRELKTTQDKIKEIATRFGYSPPAFSFWLKKKTGKTPTQIRQELWDGDG